MLLNEFCFLSVADNTFAMRIAPLVVASLISISSAIASEIREFDLKTIERLGDELTRVSQTRDRGASTPVKKVARQTAIAALKGKLFYIRYDYVVLDDPDGSGFLVYALGRGPRAGDVVMTGHFRATVSANGEKAERVDALSRSVLVENRNVVNSPSGFRRTGFYMATLVGTRPSETLIYASNLLKKPIFVGTGLRGQVWLVENGKITKSDSKK